MTVVQEDGRTFEVSFSHSLHDIKKYNAKVTAEERAGGLFQIINCMSKSFRRRVTICVISELTDAGGTKNAPQSRALAWGFTLCNESEPFVKAEGRLYSLIRALRATGWTKAEQRTFCDALGIDYDELRQTYR